MDNSQKEFFLNYGYLQVKNALPAYYVEEVLEEADIIFKKNNITDFSIKRETPFLRFNFSEHQHLNNNKRTYPKKDFQNVFDLCQDFFGTNNFKISGLDNRIFCGLKNESENIEKTIQSSYWHIDGWNNYHFLDVKHNAITMLFSFSEVKESGGTMVLPASIKHMCKLLYDYPEGIHPDSMGAYSYIIPHILNQCRDSDIHQLELDKGDVVFMHPFLLHKASINTSNTPKLVNNNHVQLNEPIKIYREDGNYSIMEQSIINNLRYFHLDNKDYHRTSKNNLAASPMARSPAEKEYHFNLMYQEMMQLKADGVETPKWVDDDLNYLSNLKSKDENQIKVEKYNYIVREK